MCRRQESALPVLITANNCAAKNLSRLLFEAQTACLRFDQLKIYLS